jgi:3-dehydroquinate dehydratase
VPVLSTITVQIAPVYSRQGLRKFSLQDYARGKMSGEGQVGYI